MSRNIPTISIGQVMHFSATGMPDHMQYEIAAIIDTTDEITPLGRLYFDDASDLVTLYNSLGTYIRMNDLDDAAREQEGGDE